MAKPIQYCKVKKKKIYIYIYYTVDPWTKCVCSFICEFFSINMFCYSTLSVVGWICQYGSMDIGTWILLTSCVLGGSTVHHSSESLPITQCFWRSIVIWWETYKLSEKAVAPHSSTLAWKIPWMEEPGGLQSMGSLRVGHDWATSLSLFTLMHWRRKWQPTPVFLPGESQGQGSLVGCRLWGHTESDTDTEVT